jgi:hypothetical protein
MLQTCKLQLCCSETHSLLQLCCSSASALLQHCCMLCCRETLHSSSQDVACIQDIHFTAALLLGYNIYMIFT